MIESIASNDGHWPDALPRYWCAGDAFETRFLEAMSLLAPEVERFVIGAVRSSMPRLREEETALQCIAFIREEVEHSRAHHAFNRRLARQGIDVPAVLERVRRADKWAKRWLPGDARLAVAAACEHLSALLSLSYLRAERTCEIRSAQTLRLFDRHAREELGHRAFVFDLLTGTGGGSWAARALALTLVSLMGVWYALRLVDELLKHEKPKGRTALWRRGVVRLLRPGSWVSPPALVRGWLCYLRPGFHPSQLPDG